MANWRGRNGGKGVTQPYKRHKISLVGRSLVSFARLLKARARRRSGRHRKGPSGPMRPEGRRICRGAG